MYICRYNRYCNRYCCRMNIGSAHHAAAWTASQPLKPNLCVCAAAWRLKAVETWKNMRMFPRLFPPPCSFPCFYRLVYFYDYCPTARLVTQILLSNRPAQGAGDWNGWRQPNKSACLSRLRMMHDRPTHRLLNAWMGCHEVSSSASHFSPSKPCVRLF